MGGSLGKDLVFLAEFVVVLGSHWVKGVARLGANCGRFFFIF